jgi:regulator of sigma E protease
MIGIAPKLEANILLSLKYSFERVIYVIKAILEFLGRLFMGQASSDGVVGPIGMAKIVGTAANSGIIDLMGIAALISVNLGIINLLPLPALDGGRIIFILIELIRGKPVPSDKEGFVHFIGFVLLMTLMLMVVFREIKMLF